MNDYDDVLNLIEPEAQTLEENHAWFDNLCRTNPLYAKYAVDSELDFND